MLSFGLMPGYGLAALVSSEYINWRTFYMIIIALATVDFLLQVFYLRRDLSVVYMYEQKLSDTTIRKVLSHYLTAIAVEQKMIETSEAYNHIVSMKEESVKFPQAEQNPENIAEDGYKKVAEVQKQSFFKRYRSEIIYGLKYSVVINFSLYNMFLTYLIFFITEDLEDNSEAALSNLVLTLAGGFELIIKFLSIYFGWTERRKLSITVGCLLLSVTIGGTGVLQFYGLWNWIKFVPFIAFSITGVLISSAFYASLAEKFPSPVIGMVQGLTTLLMFGVDFAFPLFDIKANNNENIHKWSYCFAGVMIIGALLSHFFTFECGGLSRVQATRKTKKY